MKIKKYQLFKFVFIGVLLVLSKTTLAISLNLIPKDMNELIDSSDLIVVGNFRKIINVNKHFRGYDESGNEIRDDFRKIGIPMIDYSINIIEIIKEDKIHQHGDEVIYRTFELERLAKSNKAIKKRKGTYVFFLSRNPDDKTYGIKSIMHKMKFDKDYGVIYTYENNVYIPFDDKKVKAKDFVKKVKDIVKTKKEK
jgi:hypothetical protein